MSDFFDDIKRDVKDDADRVKEAFDRYMNRIDGQDDINQIKVSEKQACAQALKAVLAAIPASASTPELEKAVETQLEKLQHTSFWNGFSEGYMEGSMSASMNNPD